jgi:hypothetical protein
MFLLALAAFSALFSAPAHATEAAAVRMLNADGELVSVRAAAQGLHAVWSDDTLVVRVGDSEALHWTPINQLPDLLTAGVTLPGWMVGIPGEEIFIGFEGLDTWDFDGDGEALEVETTRAVTGNTDITNWLMEIEGVTQGGFVRSAATHTVVVEEACSEMVIELRTDGGFWQMGLEEADPRLYQVTDRD